MVGGFVCFWVWIGYVVDGVGDDCFVMCLVWLDVLGVNVILF